MLDLMARKVLRVVEVMMADRDRKGQSDHREF